MAVGRVETKVKAATAAGAGSAGVITPFVIWLVGDLAFDGGQVPLPVVGVIGLLVTGICTFVGGWLARHAHPASGRGRRPAPTRGGRPRRQGVAGGAA